MYYNGIQSYRETDVSTSDPVKLVIMCYEGAIDSLKLAKENMKEKNFEKKAKAIIKAQDIIDELLCSLDFEKGDVIAANLSRLYNYMLRRIVHGDVNRDISAIDEVIGMLNELLSAWQTIYSQKDIETRPATDNLSYNKKTMNSGYISV
jgi:flagellar secretion chaperone FliS